MAKLVSNGSHAVQTAEVAACLKTGPSAFLYYIDVFFKSNSVPAPLCFQTEDERDAFFKELVDAMGG